MLTLGIDSSTQGVKAVVWDVAAGKVVFSAAVNYGRDLPQYGSPDGFLPNADVLVRHADPRMWVEGLELVLAKLQASGCPMGDIAAIGGDAQQHASVYLESLEPLVFSRATSPIWMDSSTSAECAALDGKFGSRLQADTGSPAIERFAGPQIMKFAKAEPESYAKTARIHLLSSFLASSLVGEVMPIDMGDGAGMNLLNLKTGDWDAEICEFTAPGLKAKLPPVKQSNNLESNTRPLLARFAKYGLKPGIPVVPFTGDNPASLVGCFAEKPGTAVISLGTSDVFFAAMDSFHTDPDGYGHVFGNPMGGFMSLSCFKNGSLARDRIRKELGVDWAFFDETAWNGPKLDVEGEPRRAFPFFEAEITPKHAATGIEANFDWASAASETKIRAIVEGQIANMYERTRWIGDFETIKVTGGASRSRGIRETIASVFKAKVEAIDVPDSAAVGGARLAARALSD
ncbi:MAG: carbohydrate kinase [Kiritimatiellae bacterium]|nr:carbohydrate kinase [Kiritimatiellia bacterium]